jgi:hypothetical protein
VQYLITSDETSNQFDFFILRSVHAFFGSCRRCFCGPVTSASSSGLDRKWYRAIANTLLAFSDQQVITFVAILGAGYSQLGCGLSTYHWQNILNLAWFSSVTHLTTLNTLRDHLRQNRGLRLWRLCGMSITAIMLIIGLGSTGFIDSDEFNHRLDRTH